MAIRRRCVRFSEEVRRVAGHEHFGRGLQIAQGSRDLLAREERTVIAAAVRSVVVDGWTAHSGRGGGSFPRRMQRVQRIGRVYETNWARQSSSSPARGSV